MIKIVLLAISLMLVGCASTASKTVRLVATDFKDTPKCDTENVYPHPKDGIPALAGKLAIANAKLDSCDDVEHRKNQKADSYLNGVLQ